MRIPAPQKTLNTDVMMAALIGLALLCVLPFGPMLTGHNDFPHLYVGGLLSGRPDLYLAQQAKQVELLGGIQPNCFFLRPPFYALLLKPLTLLPFFPAYLVFQGVSFLCLVFFLRVFAPAHKDLLTVAAMSAPVIATFVFGQDLTILIALLTIVVLLARRNADFVAGLVLSLCAMKFHLLVLVPAAVLLQRRFRIFWGAATGGLALALAGLIGGGLAVYRDWLALLQIRDYHPGPEIMLSLRGFLYAFGADTGGALLPASLAVAIATCYVAWRAESIEHALAYSLIGGLLVSFHAHMQEGLVLLFALALLRTESKYVTAPLTLALLPFPYFLLYVGPPYSAVFHSLLLLTLGAVIGCEYRAAARAAAVLNRLWLTPPLYGHARIGN